MSIGRPPFPLIRHLSAVLTPLLARSPFSANHITFVSLLLGLAASWYLLGGGRSSQIWAALLLTGCYILDNCDGEIARLKNQSSEFGRRFDNFVDWAVHTFFFAALGHGVAATTYSDLPIWLGWAAALGSTVNYIVGTVAEERERTRGVVAPSPHPDLVDDWPAGWADRLMFAFRELSRADFCFIVLALAIFDATAVLLPLGAIGAQAFWFVHLLPGARKRHV